MVRIEHWTNATEQGAAAGRRLLAADGEAQPFVPVPYVWSDQYDTKIQVVGLPRADDEVAVVDGTLEERRFVACFGREGRLTGAVAFNRPRLLVGYRRLLADGASFEDALAHAKAAS
jgi:3-phenylpropionate/trans-cinnamate dioxygenase ferredoxin reductase component